MIKWTFYSTTIASHVVAAPSAISYTNGSVVSRIRPPHEAEAGLLFFRHAALVIVTVIMSNIAQRLSARLRKLFAKHVSAYC